MWEWAVDVSIVGTKTKDTTEHRCAVQSKDSANMSLEGSLCPHLDSEQPLVVGLVTACRGKVSNIALRRWIGLFVSIFDYFLMTHLHIPPCWSPPQTCHWNLRQRSADPNVRLWTADVGTFKCIRVQADLWNKARPRPVTFFFHCRSYDKILCGKSIKHHKYKLSTWYHYIENKSEVYNRKKSSDRDREWFIPRVCMLNIVLQKHTRGSVCVCVPVWRAAAE